MDNVKLFIIQIILWHIPMSQWWRDFLMWPVASRLLSRRKKYKVMLPDGVTLVSDLSDQLTRSLIMYGHQTKYFWEPVTSRLIEILSARHQYILVAGAHIGLEAVIVRKSAPAETVVVTCEPTPYLAEFARENVGLNSTLGRIAVEEVALSDTVGKVSFTINNLKSRISTQGEVSVLTTTIDVLGKKYGMFNLILLDVEGHEYEALLGASEHLSSGKLTDIVFEVSLRMLADQKKLQHIETILCRRGYTFYRIEDEYIMGRPSVNVPVVKLYPLTNLDPDHFPNRYHNVFATLRSKAELAAFPAIVMV